MSLYPRTQTDSRLAANIVKLLDTAMGVSNDSMSEDNLNYLSVPLGAAQQTLKVAKVATDNFIKLSDPSAYPGSKKTATGMAENQGWAATFTSEDYIEEKWSKKYKDSINCANPRGFSQRAHCAGRKK